MIEPDPLIACLICGIKMGFPLYPDCKREAEKWGIHLNDPGRTAAHIWAELQEIKNGEEIWDFNVTFDDEE